MLRKVNKTTAKIIIASGFTYAVSKNMHNFRRPADAEDKPNKLPEYFDFTQPDVMQKVRNSEFLGSVENVEFEKKIKVDY